MQLGPGPTQSAFRRIESRTSTFSNVMVLRTKKDRDQAILERDEHRKRILSSVSDVLKTEPDAATTGCQSACFGFMHLLFRKHKKLGSITGEDSVAMESAIFGQKRKGVSSPAMAQLLAVGATLENRISEVQARALAMRGEADSYNRQKNRPAAMRALKRSKTLDNQCKSLLSAALAIERQSDMLEDVGLQRQVATALTASVNGMKTSQKALKQVEAVADDAADMKDVTDDIQAAMATLAEGYQDVGCDDDELAAELDAMMSEITSSAETIPSKQTSIDPTPKTITAAVYPCAPTTMYNRMDESTSDEEELLKGGTSMA